MAAIKYHFNYMTPTGVLDGNVNNYQYSACFRPPVVLPDGTMYYIYIDSNGDPGYRKSTDYGVTWGSFVALKSCTCTAVAVWYDEWSDITATKYIHVAYIDSDSDDAFYRYIDTANSDTLGTERTIYSGSSTATNGGLAITRARGGNLICAVCIDAGAEYDTVKSNDYFATQSSIAEVWEGATDDQVILVPGWAADNQDIMAFFWDASADEISRKLYDDSGNSWGESSISTGMVDKAIGPTSNFPNFNFSVDIANSQNILVAWSAVDAANADLRCWKITESAITEVTNVVLNSTDDQGGCAITINRITGNWTCFYGGKSDGSENYYSGVRLYYKESTNAGSTWGSETLVLGSSATYNATPFVNPITYTSTLMTMIVYSTACYYIVIPSIPRASYQLGM